jgi:hypothetical protein
MPKVSEIFGGAHLKAEHLNGAPRVYAVNGYDTEMIYGEEKYVLYFADEKRGLPLSATCARDIAQFLGDDMGAWSGHGIELYPEQRTITDRETQVEKSIKMIRARAPSSKLTPPPNDLDDDIPF